MDWQPLASSNLNAMRYDADTRVLQIRFNSGRTYAYRDVPENVADELASAGSPGQYFNSEIKNNYSQG